jgi:acetyltransferase-like isoleucine patch superfamily enzyme
MISPLAVVETNQIGENVIIKEFAIVRKNVIIGNHVVIHPYVVVEEGVTIGDNTEIFPGCFIGKPPKGAGATSRPISFDQKVVLSSDCAVGPNAIIYYGVEIGDHTLIGDGASVREGCQIGSYCILGRYVTLNYNTRIGNDVKIMDHSWLAGNMSVGDRVFISGGVLTANDNNLGYKGYEDELIIGPEIRDGARIGVGAILLPQIKIGASSIVAAGSVVTKNVADFNLVMGIPAKFVRSLRQD